MSRPCPLTKNYVQGLAKYIAEDVEELLYESLIEEYNFLAERAEVAGSEIRVVQLRAFVAVEIMYYDLPRHHSMGIRTPPARSWGGLTLVARTYNSLRDNIEADRTERAIIGDDEDRNDITLLTRSNEQANTDLFSLIVESAILLRRALRRRDAEQIPRIGTLLARACEVTNATPTKRIQYLRLLVDTTEEQAGRAWERLMT